jgi:FixJ family two-component response regulator
MAHDSPIPFVVGDDVSVRGWLELSILNAGWQPETFGSRNFLSRPPNCIPTCLLLDLTLSDRDAVELQKRVAAERADMPIIVITGYGDIPTSS